MRKTVAVASFAKVDIFGSFLDQIMRRCGLAQFVLADIYGSLKIWISSAFRRLMLLRR